MMEKTPAAGLKIQYRWLFWGLVIVVAVTPRLFDLGLFYGRDELAVWAWADEFTLAVWNGDIAGTLTGSDYPGIPLFWAHTLFLTVKYSLPWFFQETMIPVDMIRQTRDPAFLAERRLVSGLLTGLQIMAMTWLARRLFGWRIALLSVIFLGMDPFSLSEARVIRLQMISSLFVGLSTLAYFGYLRWRRLGWLLGSGILGGLAASSQTSAGFLVPYIWLLLLLDFLFDRMVDAAGHPPGWWQRLCHLLRNGLIWGGSAVGAFWLIWPSMWLQPLKSLEIVFDVGVGVVAYESVWHGTVFFWGQKLPDDPGLLFYPVVYAFRTTPLTWLGLVVALGLATYRLWPHRKDRSRPASATVEPTVWGQPWPAVAILLLLAQIGLITVALSAIFSKVDRYLLTVFPALNILSAIGLVALLEWAGRRAARFSLSARNRLFAAGVGVVLALQLLLMLPAHPYFFTYWNPLLGGGRAAVQTLPVGAGEGLDQVVAYLNQQPNAAGLKLICGGSHPWCAHLFQGETLRFADYAGGRWLQADYASLYISHLQRDQYPPEVVDYFMAQTPLYEANIGGATYAWLYPVPKIEHLAGPFNELAGLGQLYGYDLAPAANQGATAQPGQTVEATVWWVNMGAGVDNLVVRWLDESGYEWGRARAVPQPAYAALPPDQRAIVVSTTRLSIPSGTPPGLYFWRIGISAPDQPDLLGEFALPAEADQLVVSPGQPGHDLAHLTPAHPVNQALAPSLTLLGYDEPTQVLTAAAPSWLALYWQAQGQPADYQVRLRLLDAAGVEVQRWQGRPARGSYATSTWRPGEIVKDVWPLQVASEIAIGRYDLEIALLPANQAAPAGTFTLPDLEVWPEPIRYDLPNMQASLETNFAGHLTLLGYDLFFDTDNRGFGQLTPVFYWQSQADLRNSFDLILTLRPADGPAQAIETWQLPLGSDGAKDFWKAGEVVSTIYPLALPAVSRGSYHLDISLRNSRTGQLELIRAGPEAGSDVVRIENIQDKIVVRTGRN